MGTITDTKQQVVKNRLLEYLSTHWRLVCLLVYLIICIAYFIVFPSFVGLNRVDYISLLDTIKDLPIEMQKEALLTAYRVYEPFTLRGSGLFHLSFGAILTGAAIVNKKVDRA